MWNKAQQCPLAVSPKGGLREIGGLRRKTEEPQSLPSALAFITRYLSCGGKLQTEMKPNCTDLHLTSEPCSLPLPSFGPGVPAAQRPCFILVPGIRKSVPLSPSPLSSSSIFPHSLERPWVISLHSCLCLSPPCLLPAPQEALTLA